MRTNRLGSLYRIGGALAALALVILLSGSAWALTATDCTSCHGADVVEGHHDTTDPNSDYNQGLCENCHAGVITGNDCSACHQPTGFNNQHHTRVDGATRSCNQCHADASDPLSLAPQPSECTLCHRGDNPPVPILTFHHTKMQGSLFEPLVYNPDGSLNCAACHTDAEGTGDCASCHGPGGLRPVSRESHHAVADTSNRSCANCHTGTAPYTGSCQDCHAPREEMAFHHDYADTYYMPCDFCHSGLTSSGTPPQSSVGCKDCHAAAPEPLHHDFVMPERQLDCNNCHTGAPSKAAITGFTGCASCHTGGIATTHHANSPDYANGNCGACHTATGLVEDSCGSVACHPKLGISLIARHHNIDLIKYPVFVDQYGSVACTMCHTVSGFTFTPPDPDDCIWCHKNIVNTAGIQSKHHGTTAATNGSCATCHSGASTSGGTCDSCHGLGKIKPVTPGSHHAAAEAKSPPTACATCHAQVTPPTSCAATTCHANAESDPLQSHHASAEFAAGNCDICHSGASNIDQACASCHEANNGPDQTMIQEHHARPEYAANNCDGCHNGFAVASGCDQCHAPGKILPATPQSHHASPDYAAGNCNTCHGSIDPAKINCSGCHLSDNLTRHHTSTLTCAECHKVQLLGEACKECHGTNPEDMTVLHHGEPLTEVGGNCGACHQTINDPSVCANCHASSPHHTTTWSQTGDCAHCHAIPAWAADRPAQAACRACHGTAMHDKGGPIQHYGACAACHTQKPFHPYNSSDSDSSWDNYSRDRGSNGPGYDKFNLFISQNSRRDEEGRGTPDNQLSFSKKQISSNGATYTVPYFPTAEELKNLNLALEKTATASRSESGYSATLAVDGDVATRWWAKSTSTQWLKVDLGSRVRVGKVTLRWHSYYAREYEVRVSTDNSNWTRVVDANYGKGGMEEWTFSGRDVRYIMIYCQRPYSSNGYAVYEVEAFAP